MVLTKRKLETTLRQLAAANSRAHVLRSIISEHSMAVYGFDPADVDNDEFIDRVDGGAGIASGMSADEFDRSMRDSIEIARNYGHIK